MSDIVYDTGDYDTGLYDSTAIIKQLEIGAPPTVTVPHFDLPFRYSVGGRVEVTEQDRRRDVMNCVEAVMRTELGSRLYVPAFGIEDPTFEIQPIDLAAIESQVAINEPRAVVILTQTPDLVDNMIDVITTDIRTND